MAGASRQTGTGRDYQREIRPVAVQVPGTGHESISEKFWNLTYAIGYALNEYGQLVLKVNVKKHKLAEIQKSGAKQFSETVKNFV